MKSHTRSSLGHIVLTVGADGGNTQEDTERYKDRVALGTRNDICKVPVQAWLG